MILEIFSLCKSNIKRTKTIREITHSVLRNENYTNFSGKMYNNMHVPTAIQIAYLS